MMTNKAGSENEQESLEGRRPLKVRESHLAKAIAVWLTNKNITPNQISIMSVVFSLLSALCLIGLSLLSNFGEYASLKYQVIEYKPDVLSFIFPLLAALFIQCRLLCNLFDGMVAIEGGKSTPAGDLYNDIPDRIADSLILVAAGYTLTMISWGDALGWCAALLAVMTAYIRTLGASVGTPVDFQGPMAKQHRMALMTIACVLTAFEGYFWTPGIIYLMTLTLIIGGCFVTIFRRIREAYTFLEKPSSTTKSINN
ncbi:MAG: CDP-alcohol phosphatidyltransferase family protein [Cellvibrionaceae bacterium]